MINKDDLYDCIVNNNISVTMDGFYEEPITGKMDDKYLELNSDKFILTPHTAYNSVDAVYEMERMLIESLDI